MPDEPETPDLDVVHFATPPSGDLNPQQLASLIAEPTTVVAPQGKSIRAIATEIGDAPIDRIVVVDEEDDPETVVGLVDVKALLASFPRASGAASQTLLQAVQTILDSIDEEPPVPAEESLGGSRITIGWCEAGKHYTTLPCDEHR